MIRPRDRASAAGLLPRMEARPRKDGLVTYRYHPLGGKPVNLGTDRADAIRKVLDMNGRATDDGTVGQLWRLYQESPQWKRLAPITQRSYAQLWTMLAKVWVSWVRVPSATPVNTRKCATKAVASTFRNSHRGNTQPQRKAPPTVWPGAKSQERAISRPAASPAGPGRAAGPAWALGWVSAGWGWRSWGAFLDGGALFGGPRRAVAGYGLACSCLAISASNSARASSMWPMAARTSDSVTSTPSRNESTSGATATMNSAASCTAALAFNCWVVPRKVARTSAADLTSGMRLAMVEMADMGAPCLTGA